MRRNNHAILAVLASALSAGHAMAESVPAVPTVGELAAIQSDTLIGRAQLAKAQVYADLRKFGGENGMGAPNGETDTTLPRVPRIVEVNGVSEATLAYANGQIDAREGDHIPGGYVVEKIRPDTKTVLLRPRKGHVIEIPVSSLAGLSTTSGTPPQPTSNMMVFPPNGSMAGAPQPQQPTPANVPRLAPSFAGSGAPGAR